MLYILKQTGIKLSLPINVILDAAIYLKVLEREKFDCNSLFLKNKEKFDTDILLEACLYLASKINEIDSLRVRDIVNVTLYSINEYSFLKFKKNEPNFAEEGILKVASTPCN